jgi:hypothetical protein
VSVGDIFIVNNVRVFVAETTVSFNEIVEACIRNTNNLIYRRGWDIRKTHHCKGEGKCQCQEETKNDSLHPFSSLLLVSTLKRISLREILSTSLISP